MTAQKCPNLSDRRGLDPISTTLKLTLQTVDGLRQPRLRSTLFGEHAGEDWILDRHRAFGD